MYSGKFVPLVSRQALVLLSYTNIFFCASSMDDGSERMYYTGQGPDGSTAIGVAKLNLDETEWVREQATIVFAEV